MPGDPIDFAAIIEQDRTERQKLEWQGTFLQYLELVKQRPRLGRSLAPAHVRHDGRRRASPSWTSRPTRAPSACSATRRSRSTTSSRTSSSAWRRTIEQDRALLPLRRDGRRGEPPGALPDGPGRLRQELAGRAAASAASRTRARSTSIEGCPMYEEPLHLIPRHLRKEFEKMLGVQIEGDLCPVCRYRLKDEFGGKLRGRADQAPSRSASATGAASASCRRSTRTTRTPRS